MATPQDSSSADFADETSFPVTGSVNLPVESRGTPGSIGPRGWLWVFIVAAGGIFGALSAPGQTAGLSPFTDPLIESLGVGRTEISVSYLIATLAGGAAMPFLGKLLDRFGARVAIVWIGVVFALVLYAASFVTEIFGLTASYVGLRMAGQGALTLASTTLVARLVTHRSGLALGIAGAVSVAGISLAPVGIERLIALTDLATAWRVEAVVVAAIVIPLALLVPRDKPVTHTDTGTLITPEIQDGHTVRQAAGTLMFWVFTGAGFAVGMMSTGLAFHLISILGEQGLTSFEAASNFIPQTIAGLLCTLLLGAIVDHTDPRWGVIASMAGMGGAMVLLPFVTPGWVAFGFGILLGIAQGALRGVEAAAFVRYFGRANIGGIRGVSTSVMLGSTALGPLYFAIGLDLTGSYLAPSLWGALLPVLIIVLAGIAKTPEPVRSEEGSASGVD